MVGQGFFDLPPAYRLLGVAILSAFSLGAVMLATGIGLPHRVMVADCPVHLTETRWIACPDGREPYLRPVAEGDVDAEIGAGRGYRIPDETIPPS